MVIASSSIVKAPLSVVKGMERIRRFDVVADDAQTSELTFEICELLGVMGGHPVVGSSKDRLSVPPPELWLLLPVADAPTAASTLSRPDEVAEVSGVSPSRRLPVGSCSCNGFLSMPLLFRAS